MVANFDAFTTKLFLMLYNLKNGEDVLSLETSLPASYLSIKLAPSQNLTAPFCALGLQCCFATLLITRLPRTDRHSAMPLALLMKYLTRSISWR